MSIKYREGNVYVFRKLIDNEISELLTMFGVVAISGPRGCDKTWT